MLLAFVLAWGAREPCYVAEYTAQLRKLVVPTAQEVLDAFKPVLNVPAPPAVEHFIPRRSNLRPAWIISKWTLPLLSSHVVPALQTYLLPKKGQVTASGLIHLSNKLRNKKSHFLSTAYSAEHLIRTLLLVTETKEPGEEFVKMGSLCQNEHFDKLRRMGLYNLSDINKRIQSLSGTDCTAYRRLTPRTLCYYMCMLRLPKKSK